MSKRMTWRLYIPLITVQQLNICHIIPRNVHKVTENATDDAGCKNICLKYQQTQRNVRTTQCRQHQETYERTQPTAENRTRLQKLCEAMFCSLLLVGPSGRVLVIFNEYLRFFFRNSVDMTDFVRETNTVEFV